jgi:hypothetical protein
MNGGKKRKSKNKGKLKTKKAIKLINEIEIEIINKRK